MGAWGGCQNLTYVQLALIDLGTHFDVLREVVATAAGIVGIIAIFQLLDLIPYLGTLIVAGVLLTGLGDDQLDVEAITAYPGIA